MTAGATDQPATQPLRILAVSDLWQGANDYAFVRAFRRAGHSVRVIPEAEYFPNWRSKPLRLARRLLRNEIVEQYNKNLLREAQHLRPHLLFVFKGPLVTKKTLRTLRQMGIVCIQYFPDVSFRTHGPYLPDALREYDWVFTTKTFGLPDMVKQLGVTAASFLPHGFDPETHYPVPLSGDERERYKCDVSFIGNWSEKKHNIMEPLTKHMPNLAIKIWGPPAWKRVNKNGVYQLQPVFGLEYAKAIRMSNINIAILIEKHAGASCGDRITSRTFHIPAAGGFMLHERTEEVLQFFDEGREIACFSDFGELVDKIHYYLSHEKERQEIAEAGRQRCLNSGYSVDDRTQTVIEKYHELRNTRRQLEERDAACEQGDK